MVPSDLTRGTGANGVAVGSAAEAPGPGCEVCGQLGEAHDKYLARLRRDGRMRRGLTQALVASMGFCPGHEQLLRSDPELRDWVGLRIDEARAGFASLLSRTRLQDEVLQEIVFGARNHCPACLYCRRLAGHRISRKLRDIQAGRDRASALLSDRLCFEHARQLTERCDGGALKSRLLRALRRKGKAIIERLQARAESGASMCCDPRDTAALVEYVFDTVQAASDAGQAPGMDTVSGADLALFRGSAAAGFVSCPVCRELRQARASWLDAVSSTIRLEQPAWLALPTCAEHLGICLDGQTTAGLRALAGAYIDAAFAARRKLKPVAAPAKKRSRNSLRWFDPPARAGAEPPGGDAAAHGAAHPEEDGEELSCYMRLHCPGCQAADIALRGAVSSWLRAYACASQAGQGGLTRQLCLKHLAEALIYAPQQNLRASILSNLQAGGGGHIA